jgi:hypothetical protein
MKLKTILILICLTFSFHVLAKASSGSSGVGNGGDPVRDAFILLGKNIIQNYGNGFLEIKDELKTQGITNYKDLTKFLNIEVVHTTADALYDNRGSIVAAIGEPNSITLYVGTDYPTLNWQNIFLNTPKSERLVLHEMLRAAGVNDDNFTFTNIVLKQQGRITDEKFNFVWSKNSDVLINNALQSSLNSADQDSELNSFKKYSNTLIEQNTSRNSEFVKIYLQLMNEIDTAQLDKFEVLMAYRETFKGLRAINLTVDQIAFHLSEEDKKETAYLAKYFILSMRQIQSRIMQFQGVGSNEVANYLSSLKVLSMTKEYSADSFSALTSALAELETLAKNKAKKEIIVLKCNQLIKLLQPLTEK